MEERIARLEVTVDHIQADVAEMKVDIRRLDAKMDGMKESLDAKIDAIREALASAKIWALGLYIALAGALFAALARGFGWI